MNKHIKFKKVFLALLLIGFIPLPSYGVGGGSGNADTATVGEAANAGMNGAMGQQYAGQCSWKHNPMACIIAIASFAQVGLSLAQMLQSKNARDDLAGYGADFSHPDFRDNFGNVDPDSSEYLDPVLDAIEDGSSEAYEEAYNKLMGKSKSELKKMGAEGFKYNPEDGTVTGNGKTYDVAKAFERAGSSSAMDSLSAQAKNAMASLSNGASGSGSGFFASGSGAVGGSGLSGLNTSSLSDRSRGPSSVDDFLSKLKKGDIDSSKMAGMSKLNKDGESIGVSMNNIFKMMQSKYKSISKNQEFLPE